MNFVVIDWETYFCGSSSYTLKKMTTEEYIRDPRFEAHGCAIKWSTDTPTRWIPRANLHLLREVDWSKTCVIHHHAHFDSAIESIHYGIKPGAIACTLSMARLLLGNHVKVSLDSVRAHFGLPSKITPYHLFDGKHWDEMPPEHQREIAAGACDEVESIHTIFWKFMTGDY